MTKTLGEERVRVDFNPGNSDTVSQIKQKTAELINLVDSLKGKAESLKGGNIFETQEKFRLIAIALTNYEEAAMWAVKAATYKEN